MKNNLFKNKRILIVGGTGSWGYCLTKKLLNLEPSQIVIFSRNEFNQVKMARFYNNNKLKFIIGDVRDFEAINNACKNIDMVFHLGALKHVILCEKFPNEAIKTNIIGTENVIKASINNNIKRVIDVSSDKACEPVQVYGATKLIGERLIIHASTSQSNTKFMVIRSGNVLGSAGSILEFWINHAKNKKAIPLTNPSMTRYFLTLSQAIDLLFVAINSDINGGKFVMKMPALKLINLAEVINEYYNNKAGVKIIGIKQGEKIHESLVSKHESLNTFIYNDNYYLIMDNPTHDTVNYYKKVTFKEYNSATNLMTKEEIKELLKRGGYLK